MKIHLRPELEEMIKQDVQRGPYQSVDDSLNAPFPCSTIKKLGWQNMAARYGQRSNKATRPRNAVN